MSYYQKIPPLCGLDTKRDWSLRNNTSDSVGIEETGSSQFPIRAFSSLLRVPGGYFGTGDLILSSDSPIDVDIMQGSWMFPLTAASTANAIYSPYFRRGVPAATHHPHTCDSCLGPTNFIIVEGKVTYCQYCWEKKEKITTQLNSTVAPQKCECGADKVGDAFHSDWCAKKGTKNGN